jgi:hypothetical protein
MHEEQQTFLSSNKLEPASRQTSTGPQDTQEYGIRICLWHHIAHILLKQTAPHQ